jgi:hypothetical protein
MKQTNNLGILISFTASLLLLVGFTKPVRAADLFKIGSSTFKAESSAISGTTIAGGNIFVQMTGVKASTKAATTGTFSLNFVGLESTITQGASYDVSNISNDLEDGKVAIGFLQSVTKLSNPSSPTSISNDSDTVISGKVKITEVVGNTFSAVFTGKASNAKKTTGLSVDVEESGRVQSVVINAKITAKLAD